MFKRKNTSICNLLNLLFFLFFRYKTRISVFFTSCKMWNMFKVNHKDTRISKFNGKVKNKDTVDAFLASLLLTFNSFYFLLQSCYCWLWSVNCRMRLLFAVLVVCKHFPAQIQLWKRWKICSKLAMTIPERCRWRSTDIFFVNFEHILHLFLLFLLVTPSMYFFAG